MRFVHLQSDEKQFTVAGINCIFGIARQIVPIYCITVPSGKFMLCLSRMEIEVKDYGDTGEKVLLIFRHEGFPMKTLRKRGIWMELAKSAFHIRAVTHALKRAAALLLPCPTGALAIEANENRGFGTRILDHGQHGLTRKVKEEFVRSARCGVDAVFARVEAAGDLEKIDEKDIALGRKVGDRRQGRLSEGVWIAMADLLREVRESAGTSAPTP
jgi:hypothetical protein